MPIVESTFTGSPRPGRRVVVVLGMHRSGTSAVAGCLQRLGIDFGPRLMPATEDNPRGYYEHIDIVNLHDRLLLALDRSWDDVDPFPAQGWPQGEPADRYQAEMLRLLRRDFPTAPVWGLKDPRLCRLLPWWEPLWREMDSEPFFVLVRRAPAEVAASLARREGFSRSKSHLLWLQHMLDAERATRGRARLIVDFQAFVADWRGVLAAAGERLGWLWRMSRTEDINSTGRFLDPAIVRSKSADESAGGLPVWVKAADESLCAGLAGDEGAMHRGLDAVHHLLEAANPLYLPAKGNADSDLGKQLEATRKQAKWYEAEWQKARARADSARAQLESQKSAKG